MRAFLRWVSEYWNKTRKDPISLYTFVLACVAVFQAYLLVRGETVAIKTAQGAELSAKVANDALVTTQRPFVFVDEFQSRIVDGVFQIMPKWINNGATPAQDMKSWVSWKAFKGEPPTGFNYPDLDATGNTRAPDTEAVTFFVGPKASVFATTLGVPVRVMEAARKGECRLFIWGWTEYRDMFGNTKLHRTEFCNEVVVGKVNWKGTIVSIETNYGMYGSRNSEN